MVALALGGVTGEGDVGAGEGSAECSLQKPEGERESVWGRGLGEGAGDVRGNNGRGVACSVVGTWIGGTYGGRDTRVRSVMRGVGE